MYSPSIYGICLPVFSEVRLAQYLVSCSVLWTIVNLFVLDVGLGLPL